MFIKIDRVLCIEPHPDDIVIGAGGTIARIHRDNPKCSIWDTYICPCTEDNRNAGLLNEHQKACEILGIENIIENNYPRNSYVEKNMQTIRDFFYELKAKYQPDLVIAPTTLDFHQDHHNIAECALTTFRNDSMIWRYEVPTSTSMAFTPNIYVTLQEEDVNAKLKALNYFSTQYKARSRFFYDDAFRAHLVYRGLQCNSQWAEAFEVIGKL